MLDDLVYIQINTMMMEKFNFPEVRDIQLIDMKKLDGSLGLEDPLELEWPNENDGQAREEIFDQVRILMMIFHDYIDDIYSFL